MPKYIARKDGTYVILHNTAGSPWTAAPVITSSDWAPYHVCPATSGPIDPDSPDGPQWPEHLIYTGCAYNINEIRAYALAHPEDEVETFQSFDEAKRDTLSLLGAESWTQQRFRAGVITWEGMRCQINPGVQAKLLEYKTDIANGAAGPFAFHDADNDDHQLSPAQVLSLAAAVQKEVDCIWAELFDLKARIRAASSFAELKKIESKEHQHVAIPAAI